MTITRDDLISFAAECIDTRFEHQGRVVGAGIDCVGVARHMCVRAGFNHYYLTAYKRQPYKDQLVNKLREQPCMIEITKSQLQRADLFVCKVSRIYPQHLVVFDGDYIIHANGLRGICERVRLTRGYFQTMTHAFSWVGIHE